MSGTVLAVCEWRTRVNGLCWRALVWNECSSMRSGLLRRTVLREEDRADLLERNGHQSAYLCRNGCFCRANGHMFRYLG